MSLRPLKGMAMSNSPFEVPTEMRDFAERSVDQARQAFDSFLAVAQRTAGVVNDAAHTPGSAKSVGAHVLACTEQNVGAAFDLARKLVRVTDPKEAFALQSDYLKTQLAAMQTQAKDFGAVIQKSVVPGSN